MERHRFILYLWGALAALAIAGMYWPLAPYVAERWLAESVYYHCMAVPFIVGWLVWRQVAAHKDSPEPWPAGLVLLALGALVYLVGMRTGARFVIGLSFPLILLGVAAAVLGRKYLGALWLPLGLTAFMVPIPEHILGLIAMPMQMFSTRVTGAVTHFLGFQIAYGGVTLNLHGFKFIVAQECSGLNSLMALLLVGAVLTELAALPTLRKILSLALVFPIVIAANIVRLISVIWLGEFVGAKFALEQLVHGGSDVIVYLCAFMFVWLLVTALAPAEDKERGGGGGDGEEENWEANLTGTSG